MYVTIELVSALIAFILVTTSAIFLGWSLLGQIFAAIVISMGLSLVLKGIVAIVAVITLSIYAIASGRNVDTLVDELNKL